MTRSLLLTVAILLLVSCHCSEASVFYCDSSSSSSIGDEKFEIVTTNSNNDKYLPDMRCRFQVSQSGYYYLEIRVADTDTARLTVKVGEDVLLNHSSSQLPKYSRSLFAKRGRVEFEFNSVGDSSGRRGFAIRVERVTRCPSSWTEIANSCFGSDFAGFRLNYTDAQKACNQMRANLMQMPALAFNYNVKVLASNLPSSLIDNAWIGVTDRAERLKYTWLSGLLFDKPQDSISCSSASLSSCDSSRRCVAYKFVASSQSQPLQMAACDQTRNFVCSMQLTGQGHLYSVPQQTDGSDGLSCSRLLLPLLATVCFAATRLFN